MLFRSLGTADTIDPDGRIRDTARMEYLKKHIEALQQAVADVLSENWLS